MQNSLLQSLAGLVSTFQQAADGLAIEAQAWADQEQNAHSSMADLTGAMVNTTMVPGQGTRPPAGAPAF
jgi:hypothetical protein